MRSDGSSTMMFHDAERSFAGNSDESATRTSINHHCRGSNAHSNGNNSRNPPPSTLFVLLQLLSLIGMIAGQSTTTTDGTTECVCSPRQFYFKLDLSASCPPLPPPFPPNDVFGSGVKDYTCSIGPEPVQNDAGDLLLLDGNESTNATTTTTTSNDSNSTSKRKRLSQRRSMQESDSSSGIGKTYNSTASDYFPEVDVQWSSANFTTSALTTEADVTPVVIYSIQFLEVDTSINVINQDSAYVRGIDFVSGDVFNYTSVSAKRRGVVPGGMNMVLRGVNAAGDPIRNVFTITYTNECGVPTFREGEAIGWVVFESFEQASEETCGIVTAAPSTGGIAKETSPPSKSPSSLSSSKIPTSDDIVVSSMSYSYIYGSKSAKVAKSSKKDSSSKGGKSNYKSTEGSYGWQHPPSYSHGHGSTRPEPYRALLRDSLLNEIKLDQYDHQQRQQKKQHGIRQLVRR